MAEASQEDRRTSGDSNLKNYLLQDLEIKTKSVEAALAPLISQVGFKQYRFGALILQE